MMTEYNRIEDGVVVERFHVLPHRWNSPHGQIIVGFNTLPDTVLQAFNVIPVIRESFDSETHTLSRTPEISATEVVYRALPKDLQVLKTECKREVDEAAGDARLRSVEGGSLLLAEYWFVREEALAYKDAGYPVDVIPKSVYASMVARGTTAEDECDTILKKSNQMLDVLAQIRRIRLQAKAAIEASGDHDAVIMARDSALGILAGII